MFFRKDTQKKFDEQIELLQEQARELQRQLTAEQAQVLIKTGLVEQLQEDMALLEGQLQLAQAALDAVQKGGQGAQGELEHLADANQALQAKVQALSSQLDSAKSHGEDLERQLAAQQARVTQLDAAQQSVALLVAEKSELALAKLTLQTQSEALQAELALGRAQHAKALEQLNQQTAQIDQAGHHSLSQIKQLQAAQQYLQDKLAASEKDTLKVKADLAKVKQEADAVLSNARLELSLAQEKAAKELTALKKQLQSIGSGGSGGSEASSTPDAQRKQILQLEAQYEDSAQENELLLLQLMQAQEELVEYYEEKGRFEQLYESLKARWERLEARLPNYVDYGAIELLSFDSLSEIPSITWRVKDYAQAGVVLPEFVFQTVLQDGQPGIGLVSELHADAGADASAQAPEINALVPKLIASSAAQVEKFLGLSTTEFRQISAAAIILAQLEATQWQGFDFPAQFDPSFWRPSLKLLAVQLQALPPVLRYDAVKLKRELINPDYEHLWIELHGAVFGPRTWKKLEARLGAALVQDEGFSQFPKFEIPLIDGKSKPFESWYAESYDDAGAKLELRFSLEKNLFDSAVLSKLDEADRALVLRLVYAFPDILKRLQAQQTAIHRPWATWTSFASKAVQVLELQRQEQVKARAAQKQASDEAAAMAAIPAQQDPAAQVAIAQGAKGPAQPASRPPVKTAPRVISIGNKAPARPVAKAKPTEAVAPTKLAKPVKPAKAGAKTSTPSLVNT